MTGDFTLIAVCGLGAGEDGHSDWLQSSDISRRLDSEPGTRAFSGKLKLDPIKTLFLFSQDGLWLDVLVIGWLSVVMFVVVV